MSRSFRINAENWAVLRRQMLRETETFIDDGLRNPERYIWIPTKEVGEGGWSPLFAGIFWSQVLATS